jgi:hypothetical protein
MADTIFLALRMELEFRRVSQQFNLSLIGTFRRLGSAIDFWSSELLQLVTSDRQCPFIPPIAVYTPISFPKRMILYSLIGDARMVGKPILSVASPFSYRKLRKWW